MKQSPEDNHIQLFICGFPSGGTDLTKTILNVHPDISLNGEIPLLEKLFEHGYLSSTLLKTENDVIQLQAMLDEIDIFRPIYA